MSKKQQLSMHMGELLLSALVLMHAVNLQEMGDHVNHWKVFSFARDFGERI